MKARRTIETAREVYTHLRRGANRLPPSRKFALYLWRCQTKFTGLGSPLSIVARTPATMTFAEREHLSDPGGYRSSWSAYWVLDAARRGREQQSKVAWALSIYSCRRARTHSGGRTVPRASIQALQGMAACRRLGTLPVDTFPTCFLYLPQV